MIDVTCVIGVVDVARCRIYRRWSSSSSSLSDCVCRTTSIRLLHLRLHGTHTFIPFFDSVYRFAEWHRKSCVPMGIRLVCRTAGTIWKALWICAANTIFAFLFSKLMNVFDVVASSLSRRIHMYEWFLLPPYDSFLITSLSSSSGSCLFGLHAIWLVFFAVKIRSTSTIIWHSVHQHELSKIYKYGMPWDVSVWAHTPDHVCVEHTMSEMMWWAEYTWNTKKCLCYDPSSSNYIRFFVCLFPLLLLPLLLLLLFNLQHHLCEDITFVQSANEVSRRTQSNFTMYGGAPYTYIQSGW